MINSNEASGKQGSNGALHRGARPVSNRKIGPSALSNKPDGKITKLIALLRRPKGACVGDLMKATGWQAHSVRGAISGSIKKRLGLRVATEKTGAVRLYRITHKRAA